MNQPRPNSECSFDHLRQWVDDQEMPVRCAHVGDDALVEWSNGLMTFETSLPAIEGERLRLSMPFREWAWDLLDDALRNDQMVACMSIEVHRRAERLGVKLNDD